MKRIGSIEQAKADQMGPIFVILAGGLAWAFMSAIIVGVIALVWWVVKPRKTALRLLLAGVGALGICAPIVIVGALIIKIQVEPASAKFLAVFGVEPPDSISNLEASEAWGTDFDDVRLGFTATQADIEAITTKLQFVLRDGEHPTSRLDSGGPPWWTASGCPSIEVYTFEARSLRPWEQRDLFWCPATGRVLVHAFWLE